MPSHATNAALISTATLGQTQSQQPSILTAPLQQVARQALLTAGKELDQAITSISKELKQNGWIDNKDITAMVGTLRVATDSGNKLIKQFGSAAGMPQQAQKDFNLLADSVKNFADSYTELKGMQAKSPNDPRILLKSLEVRKDFDLVERSAHNFLQSAGMAAGGAGRQPGAGSVLTASDFEKQVHARAAELQQLGKDAETAVKSMKHLTITDARITNGIAAIGDKLTEFKQLIEDAKQAGIAVNPRIEKSVKDMGAWQQNAKKSYEQAQALEAAGTRWYHLPSNFKMQGYTADVQTGVWAVSELARKLDKI